MSIAFDLSALSVPADPQPILTDLIVSPATDIRILSYGCSNGDEVFSLRRYFTRAIIKGLDINSGSIAVCRRRLRKSPDAAISFATASSAKAEPSSTYDAIFCMAVLRHGSLGLPGVTRCDHLIRFDNFLRARWPISSAV